MTRPPAAMPAALLLAALLAPGPAHADTFEMDELETEDFRILYFDPFQTYLTPLVGATFYNSLQFQRRVFNWTPHEKSTVLLTDLSDYGNAGAGSSPSNGVTFYIAPPSHTLETLPGSERIYSTMNHEVVHLANMDVANSRDRAWRGFFGGKPRETDEHPESIFYNYLTVPRLSVPRWYLEGAASFMETWMAGGIGRAQGAYDEMVFRAMVRDDAHFYSNLGLVSKGVAADFQTGTNAYLYGTRFFSYLADVHSPEAVIEWLRRDEDSEAYYAKQFAKVFGKPLESAWSDWIAWEHEFQAANLQAVRQYPLTQGRRLTRRGLGSVSRSFYDTATQSLVGAFQYPGVVAYAGRVSVEDGSIRKLVDIKGPMKYRVTSTAFDPESRTLFYAADNNAWRDLMAVNVDTGKARMLLEDARIGDICFDESDKSLWGLRHLNGYVTLVRIPHPYTNWNQVHTWPYGTEPFELDVSPDGSMLSMSVGQLDGTQFMRVFRRADLEAGKVEPIAQFDFGTAIPEGFVFTRDGRYLYGSSYFTGVSNIFRYELATGELEAVSNAETGFFRPIPMADGTLIVQEYTGAGFEPTVIDPKPLEDVSAVNFLGAQIARKHPIVKEWVVQPPSTVDLESMIKGRGKYRPIRELGLADSYPIVEGYRDSAALGWHVRFEDPAQFHKLDISASYSPDEALPSDERPHVNVRYQTPVWRWEYWHNGADFYDLFGPTKRSRKGDAFIGEYEKALIFDDPRRLDLSIGAAYFTGLDTLPANQNVPSGFSELTSGRVELAYTDTRRSQGSVDHEKGHRWDVVADVDHAGGDSIQRLRGSFDFGFALPLGNASVWLYNSAGVAGGNRDNSLSSFYFGGFGNNYVDDGDIKRYRDFDRFPGFEIDALAGRDFGKSILEMNLPPLRFEEVGTPGFFLGHARPALFVGMLTAHPADGTGRRTVYDAGAQVDLSLTVLNRLGMTLSFGYAAGFEDGRKVDDEWMLSLKIL
ncbi:MAG TPA: hypothetical protein VNO53_04585 [Steroidobacteraceae bacterium]|nr:hypothetical protein [Steroidobacteraceae bacterium]